MRSATRASPGPHRAMARYSGDFFADFGFDVEVWTGRQEAEGAGTSGEAFAGCEVSDAFHEGEGYAGDVCDGGPGGGDG